MPQPEHVEDSSTVPRCLGKVVEVLEELVLTN